MIHMPYNFLRALLCVVIMVSAISANAAERKGRPARPVPSVEAPGGDDAAEVTPHRLLRDAYLRFVEGKREEAVELCQGLLEENDASVRPYALYLIGRCLWDSADARDRAEARKAWDELARQGGDDSNAWAYVNIARALVLEEKSLRDAIVTLQQVVNKERGGLSMVEVRIELAHMLGNAHRIEEAKACLEAAERVVKEQTHGYAEEAAPYQKAIAKVRRGLREEQNPGLAEVEAADALLRDGQYAEAWRAYGEVVERYPKAESADRAQVGVGQALCGLNRTREAMAGWSKFLAAKPAGRWRGQAFAATLDVLLEGQGSDLLKTAEWADTSLALGLAEKEAGASWKSIESELHLRIGIARWVNGKGEKAAGNFQRVQHLSTGDSAKALEALIPVVKANRSILPEGVGQRGQLDAAGLSLSLAVVHGLSGKHEASQAYVARVLDRRVGARAEQMAFAQLLSVCLDEAKGDTGGADIHKRYQALARQYGNASWADEVMYRLGAMQDVRAAKATDTDPMKFGEGWRKAGEPAKVEPAEMVLDAKIEANVQDCYRAIVDKWPGSPRRERAMWRLGRILLDGGNAEEADQVFAAELRDYPKGAYAGDAIVRQIDVAIERFFDRQRAKQFVESAVGWLQHIPADQRTQDFATLEPWRLLGCTPSVPQGDWIRYEIFIRGAVVYYLCGDPEKALQCIDTVGVEGEKGGAGGTDWRKIGLRYLRKKVAGSPSTHPEALAAAQNDVQRTALVLGELYLDGMRPDRAEAVFRRLADADPVFGKVPPGVEGYAILELATALDRQPGKEPEAIKCMVRLREARFEKTLWGPWGLLRSGAFIYNKTQDPRKANPYYEEMLRKYPNHPQADLAMVFLFENLVRMKDWAYARQVGTELQRRYPANEWADVVAEKLKTCDEELAKTNH